MLFIGLFFSFLLVGTGFAHVPFLDDGSHDSITTAWEFPDPVETRLLMVSFDCPSTASYSKVLINDTSLYLVVTLGIPNITSLYSYRPSLWAIGKNVSIPSTYETDSLSQIGLSQSPTFKPSVPRGLNAVEYPTEDTGIFLPFTEAATGMSGFGLLQANITLSGPGTVYFALQPIEHRRGRIFMALGYNETTEIGGGLFIGYNKEHDEWNRTFADSQHVVVIGLDHSKAPRNPFPGPVHDIEALMLAALADKTIPLDRSSHYPINRIALLGFASGGNLALAVSQLPSIHNHPLAPAAVMSVAGVLDFSIPTEKKLANRFYKPSLKPSKRGGRDSFGPVMPALCWGYVPYGVDLCNPLLSQGYADLLMPSGELLDRNKFIMGVPIRGLEEGAPDDRFAFEEHWQGGGVKWLLVPDVLHGFDHRFYREMDTRREDIQDAEAKAETYMSELGTWLRERVWRL
ncbi:hypothetical protein TrVFT333_009344 [Trichoderma virens FT-333]|nr:hypothetical protein TrVFT333_009344 [Trichoderma virens FT-333]